MASAARPAFKLNLSIRRTLCCWSCSAVDAQGEDEFLPIVQALAITPLASTMNCLTLTGSSRPAALPEFFSDVLTMAPSARLDNLLEVLFVTPPPTRTGSLGVFALGRTHEIEGFGVALARQHQAVRTAKSHGELDIFDETARSQRRAGAIMHISEDRHVVGSQGVARLDRLVRLGCLQPEGRHHGADVDLDAHEVGA